MCVANGNTKSTQAGRKSVAVPRRGANDTLTDHTHTLSLSLIHTQLCTHMHVNGHTFCKTHTADTRAHVQRKNTAEQEGKEGPKTKPKREINSDTGLCHQPLIRETRGSFIQLRRPLLQDPSDYVSTSGGIQL